VLAAAPAPHRYSPALRRPSALSRWLLLFGFVLMVLAPSLSQATAALRGEPSSWSQICRSSVVSPRAQQSVLAARAAAEQDSPHGLFADCPACSLAGQDLAPAPPSTACPVLQSSLAFAMPERFYSAPHSAHAWAPAQSRAPPAAA